MGFAGKLCSISSSAILFWCISLLVPCGFSTPASTTTTRSGGNETDRLALLAMKTQMHDPFGATRSWNDSVTFCHWKGITCSLRHQRVIRLELQYQNLGGSLSPYIGNLSFLRVINLDGNKFNGEIPHEIGHLFRLRASLLANNSFGGTIPSNISRCSNLVYFVADDNNLVGELPEELGYLSKLEMLSIESNHLTGLPASIGNLSALQTLSLVTNSLRGRIPDTLGQLKSLSFLHLGENKLSGMVPPPIYNISSLESIFLILNQLLGNLPHHLGFTLPNLKVLVLAENNFTGPLPDSLSNASKLELFTIQANYFTGKVSTNFNGFQNLKLLNLGRNDLGTGAADDLDFVTSLINCSRLDKLGIYMNQFGGMLPNSIANLSKTVTGIAVGFNQISGTIPSGIINLVNLTVIGMESNLLTGTIPYAIGTLKRLQFLALAANNLSGRIPACLGNLTLLNKLDLGANKLQGSIPPALGNCQNLVLLALSQNKLTGTVPPQILSIMTLSIVLNLFDNLLSGSFPPEVGSLKTLIALDISGNQLSGEIPASLGGCTSLEQLSLAGNYFYGSIPPSLSSLRSIKELDLSRNNFSGQIPTYFENLSFLEYLNLSYNHFEGQVPTKGVFNNTTAVLVIGNDKLCGGVAQLHLPSCHFKESKKPSLTLSLKLVVIGCGLLGFILMSASILLCWFKNKKAKEEPSSASCSRNSILKVSYQQLLQATNGFSSANLIGEGSFGRVYIGILDQNQDSNIVGVKVINLQHRGASKSFMAECKTLRNIRHRNLVKIISACSSVDFQGNAFKALVYEFMPNGSLERWLHIANGVNGEPRGLSFLQRLNIAIDVASALDYLHHHCQVPIVHCDLKPSNVLLDNDMVARVGDFGLARFFSKADKFSANQTSSLELKGTVGYAAPEYGMGSKATKKGDVYSYGILLLEMFTGRRPTDDMFRDGLNLHDFAKMALPEQLIKIVDPLLLSEADVEENERMKNNRMHECLISILKIGVVCSVESPKERMDISDATNELHLMRESFLGNGTHAGR